MAKLSWLHLSDWHQSGEDFDRKVVRDHLVEDIRNRVEIDPRLEEIAFIVFSGDAAFRGLAAEFEAARKNLFDPVLEATGLKPSQLFFVPGNHDLKRNVIPELLPVELQKPLASDQRVHYWLTNEKMRRKALEDPFEDYTKFVTGYTGQSTPEYASVQKMNIDGQAVALLGLNTSWMCGRYKDPQGEVNDYGFLNIGEPQIHDALASIKDADVRIAVGHHSFGWLQEFERSLIEDRLKRDCHFILRGHEHEPNLHRASGVQGECVLIPAGASYDRRKASDPRYVNAYNFVHVDPGAGKGVIFFQRWSERQTRWIPDTDTSSTGGRHDFGLPKKLGQRSATPPVAVKTGSAAGPDLGALEREYRDRTIDSFRNLSFRGLTSSVRPILLPLEKVYVQLRAVAEVPEAADEFTPEERRILRVLDEKDGAGHMEAGDLREAYMRLDAMRRDRWTRDRLERFPIAGTLKNPARRGIVILGDPGSGKSTLLNFLALVFARGPEAVKEHLSIEGDEANRLPIIAPLAAYDDALNRNSGLTIREFLVQYFERQNMPGVGPLFEQAMDSGRALVLLDGMDEVLDENRRKFVAEQASAFIRALIHRGNRVLLTSRIYGYRSAPLSVDLPHITVLDFRREEIEVFARQWNRAITEWEFADRSPADRLALAGESERQLLEEIQSNAGVQKLAANPLLLSMLALLRRQVGRLPQQRIRLYALYLGALIEAWESIRSRGARVNAPAHPDAAKTDLVLIPLALWLQNHKPSGTATEGEILAQIRAVYLREAGLPPDTAQDAPGWSEAHVRARKFLEDMRRFSGLLVERGHGAFGFRHLTFQEYYVGRALARMTADDRWDLLSANLHANRWREPILLAAAQLGNMQTEEEAATDLVTRILSSNSGHERILHRDLFLAADCAADDINVRILTVREIVERLQPLALSPISPLAEAAVRRLVGLALLTTGDKPRLPEAVDALIPAIPTVDSQGMSLESFFALTGVLFEPFPIFSETVAERLEDEDIRVRSAVIRAFSPLLLEQPRLREAVIRKLEDQDESVRSAAVRALAPLLSGQPGLREVVARKLEAETAYVRTAAIDALASVLAEEPRSREAVVFALGDPSYGVKSAAIWALAPLLTGQPELDEPVVKTLEDYDADVRSVAVLALAPLLMRQPELCEAVVRKLEDPNLRVRSEAIRALAPLMTKQPRLCEAVVKTLEDPFPSVRSEAIVALAPLMAERQGLRELVVKTLEDPFPSVRSEAIEALYPFDEHRRSIVGLFSHRHWGTRRDMALTFAEHLEQSRHNIAMVLDDLNCLEAGLTRSAAIGALAPLLVAQPLLRDAVARKLGDQDVRVKIAAVRALAPLLAEQPKLREAVASNLESEYADVRTATIEAVAPLLAEQPKLREAVASNLESEYVDVRTAAIEALAPLLAEQPRLCEAVVKKLEEPYFSVFTAAVRALVPLLAGQPKLREAVLYKVERLYAKMDIETLGPLLVSHPRLCNVIIRGLRDPNLRISAMRELTLLLADQLGVCEAVVNKLKSYDAFVRIAAIEALAPVLAERPVLLQAVVHVLDDYDHYVRSAAIRALAPLVTAWPRLREAVVSSLEDQYSSMRSAAIRALAPLLTEEPGLRDAVVNKLEDPDEDVRSAAVDALTPLLVGEPGLREAVVAKLEDPVPRVGLAAIGALASLISDASIRRRLAPAFRMDDSELRMAPLLVWDSPRAALAKSWGRWLVHEPLRHDEVLEMLSSEDSRLRQSGIDILTEMGRDMPVQAVPLLVTAMDDHRGFDSWPARITAAELLINDVHLSGRAIKTLLPALEYGAHPMAIVPDAAEIRKSAALALGKLKADEYRPEVAATIEKLLESERDPQVLSSLFSALYSLASASA